MSEWISVKHSVPNENKAVLVWCPEHENIYLAYVKNGVWMFFGGLIAVCNDAVTHWMPIPDPPKENEKQMRGGDSVKCKFEHEGDCFNCSSLQYMYRCKPDVCQSAVPMTNADRIRAMSDEEMATELINTIFDLCEDGVPREDYVLNWLRQPVEED